MFFRHSRMCFARNNGALFISSFAAKYWRNVWKEYSAVISSFEGIEIAQNSSGGVAGATAPARWIDENETDVEFEA